MPALDIFRDDAFSLTSLTDGILSVPHKPGRLGAMGLFGEKGITTTSIILEEKDGRLSLIAVTPRGAPASNIGAEKRTARAFIIQHLERESTVLADEIQGVRAFGSESDVDTVTGIVNERLVDLRAMHEVTLEHLRIGALKGIIYDSNGSTVLYNLFTEFGVSQQTSTVDPDSSTDNHDSLRGEIVAIQRLIETELGNEPVSGYHAFCGATFFDALRGDVGVTATMRYADPASLLNQTPGRRSFSFGGVTWEEYRGTVGGVAFVPAAEAYVFPTGTNYFKTYFAPADYIETVNTVGLPLYAKMVQDTELNRWAKVHTQSNPLPLCLKPRIVVKVTLAT